MFAPILIVFLFFQLFRQSTSDYASSLRVTEVLYTASPVTDQEMIWGYSQSDFTFIELQNIGSVSMDINGLQLYGGILYTLSKQFILNPNSYCVVVKKKKAFLTRYPYAQDKVVGEFKGSLGAGDNITFAVGATLVQQFLYYDWWPEASSYGFPIVIRNPSLSVSTWNLKDSWFVGVQSGTPGSADTVGSAAVKFSSSQVLYTNDFSVSLSLEGALPGVTGVIHYTNDLTFPSLSSPIYASPIFIGGKSVRVRAFAVLNNGAQTANFSHTYMKLHSDLTTWYIQNLPIVIVDCFGNSGIQSTSKVNVDCHVVIVNPSTLPTIVPGKIVSDVDVQWESMAIMSVHGSSSSSLPKKSWSINFFDSAGDNRNMQPFGLPKESDWILYGASLFDRVWIRNAMVYQLSRELFGYYAARTKFVEVFLNQDANEVSSSDYFGSYSWMEKLKVDNNRVDITKMRTWDNVAPNITGGWFIKIDRGDINLKGSDTFTSINGQNTFVYISPSYAEITQSQKTYIDNWWKTFDNVLAQTTTTSPADPAYWSLMDVNPSIDYHILYAWTKNVDSLRLSCYLHKERDGKFTWGPVWDFDRSIGCDDDSSCNGPFELGFSQIQNYWSTFFNHYSFVRRYSQRYAYWRRNGFNITTVKNYANAMVAEFQPTRSRNIYRWADSQPSPSYDAALQRMIDFATQRFTYMDSLFCFGSTPTCNDNDYCTDNICTIQSLCVTMSNDCPWPQCRYTSNDGGSCNDGNECTVSDTCTAGVCQGSTRSCDDRLACTTDSCNSTTGCLSTPNDSLCEDQFNCTTSICDIVLGCVATAHSERCDDNIACTTNVCDINNGCVFLPNDLLCNDKINCTVDTCDPKLGCVFTPLHELCDDHHDCSTNLCDPLKGGCTFLANDSYCNDSIACTVDTCDPTLFTCRFTPDNTLCDDHKECTVKTCNALEGCQFTPSDELCDDHLNCTSDFCDFTSCKHVPVIEKCNDGIACTKDTCQVSIGCVFVPTNYCSSVVPFNSSCYTGICQPSQGVCVFSRVCETPELEPIFDCFDKRSNVYFFYLGYENFGDEAIDIPVGPLNRFEEGDEDRGQPTHFSRGKFSGYPFSPFVLNSTSSRLTWSLNNQSLVIDTTNVLKKCPSVITLFMYVNYTSFINLTSHSALLNNLRNIISDYLKTKLIINKEAVTTSNVTIYSVLFNGTDSLSKANSYCSSIKSKDDLYSNITAALPGEILDYGCGFSMIENDSANQQQQQQQPPSSGLEWWMYVAIGAGVLLLIVVIVVVLCVVKSSTTEIV